jgi:hypothetical protein
VQENKAKLGDIIMPAPGSWWLVVVMLHVMLAGAGSKQAKPRDALLAFTGFPLADL